MTEKTKRFIEKAKVIHGEKYSYELTDYLTAHKDIIIVCPIHGTFKQRPDAHIHQKQGCKICGMKNRKHPLQKDNNTFLKQAKEKWQDKYDYSITNYKNKITKLKYICKDHGIIEQLPTLHLRNGCPFCSGRGISKHSLTSFVNIANKVHDNKYDYSKTTFLRMNDDIDIICPTHGIFTQRAGNHIHLKNGCPSCAKAMTTSRAEKEILNFIQINYSGNISENNRTILNGKEIDIYLPDLKLGFEYHGLHYHVETVRGRKHHYDKWKLASENNVKLIQIYENEYENNRSLIESKINYYLGKTNKIHARKTQIIEVNRFDREEFLNLNHLQGQDSSKIAYGLMYNNELISLMTFGPSRFNKLYKYELLRFCTKQGNTVVGGASKLLKHFRKNHDGSIISYADKRYSNGNLYKNLGFTLDGHTQPSFSYVNLKNNKLYNRMKYQKKNIKTMPFYDENLKEYEVMQLNGFDRIWDAGHFRFVLN